MIIVITITIIVNHRVVIYMHIFRITAGQRNTLEFYRFGNKIAATIVRLCCACAASVIHRDIFLPTTRYRK